MNRLSDANPYIGPRAFTLAERERFFGRAAEVRRLFYLLTAERVVLLHSPSGAGKSSLIQAGLIPRLQVEGFSVLPTIRVNAEVPRETAAFTPNRYTLATLLALDEPLAGAQQTPLERLATLSLDAYLRARPGAAPPDGSEVLIFDQFEEVLTADPLDREGKEIFFTQLAEALRDRRRWALFAVREEYVAALEPFARVLPTRLSNTCRLELLGPEAARQAMRGPSRTAGVEFTEEAAERLADDLRRTVVQQPDGSSAEMLGQSVEPVQLQVVCYRLWERTAAIRAPGVLRIDVGDLEGAGDVDSALAGYYADRLAAVAAETGLAERVVRDWFERELITEDGLRGQVLQQAGSSGGLANQAIRLLVNAHLVRAEQRRGAIWYELAHDRLVAPIRRDNASWRDLHLSPLQRQAELWDRQGRPDGMLFQGATLNEAIHWAREHSDEMTEAEHSFMREALEQRERLKAEKRANRRVRIFAWIAGVGGLVALGLSLLAFFLYGQAVDALALADFSFNEAETAAARAEDSAERAESALGQSRTAEALAVTAQARAEDQLLVARAQALAAQAQLQSARAPDRARLLAVEAYRASNPPVPAAVQALQDVVSTPIGKLVGGGPIPTGPAALSNGGRLFAVAGTDGMLRVYDLARPAQAIFPAGAPPVSGTLAFSPDTELLAVVSAAGQAHVWPTAALDGPPVALDTGGAQVLALVFSPDSATLALGCADGSLRLWTAGTSPAAQPALEATAAPVTALSFSANGRRLVFGDGEGRVFVWSDPGQGGTVEEQESSGLVVHKVLINDAGEVATLWDDPRGDIALDESGAVTASIRDTVRTYYIGGASNTRLEGRFEEIRLQVLSRSGRYIAGARGDGSIRLYVGGVQGTRVVLPGQVGPLSALTFSDDEQWLAAQGRSGAVLWNMSDVGASGGPAKLKTMDYIRGLGFRPDGTLVIAALDLLGWKPGNTPEDVQRLIPQPFSLSFPGGTILSSDARYIAASTSTGLVLADSATRESISLGGVRPLSNAMAFSADGSLFGAASANEALVWRTAAPDAPAARYELEGIDAMAISPDGAYIAAGTSDGSISLWPIGEEARGATGEIGTAVSALAFSPDGAWLAAVGPDQVVVFDASNLAAEPRQIARSGGTIVRFSPDGDLLFVGVANTLQVWSLSRFGDDPVSIESFEGSSSALAFSPDGYRVAVGTLSGDILLYDTALLLRDPLVLRGYPRSIYAIAFSSDGRYLAAGGRDISVLIWNIHPEELLATACAGAGRSLTKEEWATYLGRDLPYDPAC